MNERIRELAEQATSIVESPPNREGWTSSYAYFDKEKFAELIVRECAGLLDGEWEKEILCGSDAAGILKQHFGVES